MSSHKSLNSIGSHRRLIELSGLFDGDWYCDSYPDVTGNALDHYMAHGAFERRSPGPDFDAAWYLDTNPDVARAGENPLLHYLLFGRIEGRSKRSVVVPLANQLRSLWPQIKADALALQDQINPLSPIPRLLQFWESNIVPAPSVHTGTVVQKVLSRIPSGVDHLLILPWLGVSGGSEKVSQRLIAALKLHYEPGKLAILAPDAIFDLSPIRRHLYEIPIIAINDCDKNLSMADRAEVVDHVFVNLRPATAHVINSEAGWDALRERAHHYSKDTNLFVNIYSDIRWRDGGPAGYFWRYLPELICHLAGVFADNSTVVERAIKYFALLPEQRKLFHIVPTPILGLNGRDPASECREYVPSSSERTLWMSRIAQEKRLDVVRQIASLLPHRRFSIYGAILPGVVPSDFLSWTGETANVEHLGSFESLEALPIDSFDSYLFTTSAEGMPLSLLEATMLGLPTVAPDIGGIGEFIDEKTGWLVPHFDAADEFAAALEEIAVHPAEARRRVERAQKRLIERHSWNNFAKVISSIPGYLVKGAAHGVR